MRVYPFQFIDASRTLSLRLRFESNCMPYHQPLYLELPWNVDYGLEMDSHPTEVMIYLFDRLLGMTFSQPVKQVLMRKTYINYHQVKVSPSNYKHRSVSTTNLNYFLVKGTEGEYLMNKKDLEKLWSVDYPYLCSVQENRQYFVCDIKNIV